MSVLRTAVAGAARARARIPTGSGAVVAPGCGRGPTGPPITILHLTGEIDLGTRAIASAALAAGRAAATAAAAPSPRRAPGGLVIDVAGLGFCEASGLTQLVGTTQSAAHDGATCALAGPSPHLRRVLAVLLPDDRPVTYPSISSAVRALRRRRDTLLRR